jgi:hypothetical protein
MHEANGLNAGKCDYALGEILTFAKAVFAARCQSIVSYPVIFDWRLVLRDVLDVLQDIASLGRPMTTGHAPIPGGGGQQRIITTVIESIKPMFQSFAPNILDLAHKQPK